MKKTVFALIVLMVSISALAQTDSIDRHGD